MYLITGLGNPGKEYEDTRHNLGFEVIGRLALEHGAVLKTDRKFKAKAARVELEKEQAVLLAPQTFMNLSGQAVKAAADYYKIPPEKIVLVYDDIDLEEGQVRIKVGGGSAGHKGVDSVIEHLKTRDFVRVRIGAGRPEKKEAAEHVLSKLAEGKKEIFSCASAAAALAVTQIISSGAQAAMNKHNGILANADGPL